MSLIKLFCQVYDIHYYRQPLLSIPVTWGSKDKLPNPHRAHYIRPGNSSKPFKRLNIIPQNSQIVQFYTSIFIIPSNRLCCCSHPDCLWKSLHQLMTKYENLLSACWFLDASAFGGISLLFPAKAFCFFNYCSRFYFQYVGLPRTILDTSRQNRYAWEHF